MRAKRKAVECGDGFTMSVQADDGKYCSPKADSGPYLSAEVGFPSHYDIHLHPYAEDPSNPTETVYGWVPAHVIRMVIDSHGGMIGGELPLFTEPAWAGENDLVK